MEIGKGWELEGSSLGLSDPTRQSQPQFLRPTSEHQTSGGGGC